MQYIRFEHPTAIWTLYTCICLKDMFFFFFYYNSKVCTWCFRYLPCSLYYVAGSCTVAMTEVLPLGINIECMYEFVHARMNVCLSFCLLSKLPPQTQRCQTACHTTIYCHFCKTLSSSSVNLMEKVSISGFANDSKYICTVHLCRV